MEVGTRVGLDDFFMDRDEDLKVLSRGLLDSGLLSSNLLLKGCRFLMYHLVYYSIKIKEERVMGVTNNPTESEVSVYRGSCGGLCLD